MKVLKYFKLLNLLLLVSSAVQDENIEKLAKFACDVVEELVRDQPETKTVSITLWSTWFDKNFLYNSIAQCMTPEVAVVTKDFHKALLHDSALTSDIVIMICDQVSWRLFDSITNEMIAERIFNHNAKFLMLTKYSDPCLNWKTPDQPCTFIDYYQTLASFTHRGIFNFVWAYLEGDEINPFIYDFSTHSASNQKEKLKNNSLIRVLYPDKLKDLNRLTLNILVHLQPPRVLIDENGKVLSKLLEFIYIVREKMNVNFQKDSFSEYYKENTLGDFQQEYKRKRNQRSFVLTLNNLFRVQDQAAKLLTYEDSNDCVFVPLPKDETFGPELFVKPFDKFVWLALGLSFLISGVFWKIFLKLYTVSSSWKFLFGFYGYLLGQDVNIRNRELGLKILLQIIIFMTIILSSSYEGVITSLIIGRTEKRLKTLDEVLKGDYTLVVGDYYDMLLQDNELYKFAKFEGRVNTLGTTRKNNFTNSYEQNVALMAPCSVTEAFMQEDEEAASFYYILPEKLFSSFVRLDAGYNNPYIGRIQQIMDECFAAGLHQAWDTFSDINQKKFDLIPENHAIEVKDLKPVFMLLIFGNALAFAIFLAEIILKTIRNRRVSPQDDVIVL